MNRRRCKNYKTFTSILESVDTVNFLGATTTSRTLSVAGVGLIVVPISSGIACALSLGNRMLHKMILNNYIKYKKQYQKYQQTIKSFDKLYRRSLEENLIDKNEYESFCNIFNNYVDEKKNESFYKYAGFAASSNCEHQHKIKIKFSQG